MTIYLNIPLIGALRLFPVIFSFVFVGVLLLVSFPFFFWSNAVMNICTCILLQLNLFSKDLSQVELLKQIVLSIFFQGINNQTMLYEQIYYSVWTCNQGLWITVDESGCPKPHSVALFWAFHLQSLELPHTLPPAPI